MAKDFCLPLNELSEYRLMNKNQGFTLLELIITMVIAGILAAYAIPAFNNTIAQSRLTSRINALSGAVNLARSEAIEANAQVIVEPSADGGTQLRNLATGVVLKTFSAPNDDISVTPANYSVTFQANGYRVFGAPVALLDVKSSKLGTCRRITVSTAGSVSIGDC